MPVALMKLPEATTRAVGLGLQARGAALDAFPRG